MKNEELFYAVIAAQADFIVDNFNPLLYHTKASRGN